MYFVNILDFANVQIFSFITAFSFHFIDLVNNAVKMEYKNPRNQDLVWKLIQYNITRIVVIKNY